MRALTLLIPLCLFAGCAGSVRTLSPEFTQAAEARGESAIAMTLDKVP